VSRQEDFVSRIKRFAVVALLGLAAVPASAAAVSTAWVQLRSNNQDECIAIGQRAVAAAGFRVSVSQDRQSIFGWRGDESLTVRCIGSQRVAAVFAWVNDQSSDSAQLVEAVTRAYRAPPVPRGNLTGGGNLGGGNLGSGGTYGGGGNLGGGGVVKR
jgi:hypothetical protein